MDNSTGNAQSKMVQSFASPIPIQPMDQARNIPMLANQMFEWSGKCATSPARISGKVSQFGMRLVCRLYKLMAKTDIYKHVIRCG